MYNEKDEKYTIAIPLYRIDKDLKLLIKRLLGILCIINILIFVIYNLFKIYINYKALQNQIKILRINETELLEEFKIQDKLNQMFYFVIDNTNDNKIILNNVINNSIKYLQNYFKFKDLKITIDKRAHNWDLFKEINSQKAIKQLAASIFSGNSPDSNFDQKWDNWARILFVGCLEYLTKNKIYSPTKLFELLHKIPLEELAQLLTNTSASAILTTKSDNNQAPHNIPINAIETTEWMEYLSDSLLLKKIPFHLKNGLKDLKNKTPLISGYL